jgi:hypothetical protein
MNIKEAINNKPKSIVNNTTAKSKFPKEKVDGFYQAIHNTNMIEVVESIKKESITKP